MKKTALNVLMCVSIFLAGCFGREANPVELSMPKDAESSCEVLQSEMDNLCADMKVLKPKTNKFWTNTIWFIILPFIMDVKEAEKIEYNAMQRRHNHLLIIAREKECGFADSIEPIKAVD